MAKLTAGLGQRTNKGTLITRSILDLAAQDERVNISIKEDNTEQIVNAIDKALVTTLEKMGLKAEGYAKKLCPVDTGRLRNSITHSIDANEKAVYIGTNVEYGPPVEARVSFLRKALTDHKEEYINIARQSMQS